MFPIRSIRSLGLLLVLVTCLVTLATPEPATALCNRSKIKGLPGESVAVFNACVTMARFMETQSTQQACLDSCCTIADDSCSADRDASKVGDDRDYGCQIACDDA